MAYLWAFTAFAHTPCLCSTAWYVSPAGTTHCRRWLVGAMAAREIPNLKVVGSIPTSVSLSSPSLAQLAERLTVVVASRHRRHQHVAGSIPAARILLLPCPSLCNSSCGAVCPNAADMHQCHGTMQQNAVAGNRTPVSRVTGGDNHHYTTTTHSQCCTGISRFYQGSNLEPPVP
jgi:hypothetical protein